MAIPLPGKITPGKSELPIPRGKGPLVDLAHDLLRLLSPVQIIKTFAERMSYRPWKHAYLLDRAQCGRSKDFDPAVLKQSKLALDVDSGKILTS